MSFNLLEAAKGLFTSELISKASGYLEEKESGVAKALSAIIPTVLRLFSDKANSTNGTNILSVMVKGQQNLGTHNLSSYFSNEGGSLLNKGAHLAQDLFGNKLDRVTDSISSYASIKHSSTSSLISMAIPALLGLVGKQSASNNVTIANVFEDQKRNILSAIPSGLDLKNIFIPETKVSDISKYQKVTVSDMPHRNDNEYEREGSNGLRWLLPLLLLVLAAMAAFYFFSKGCNNADTIEITTDTANAIHTSALAKGKIDTLTGDWMYDEGDTITLTLPDNGGNITVGKYSTEARLIDFLSDNNAVIDTAKGNWFELTNVHFKTGSSEITDTSKKQLNNIVMICKAFHIAKFKLGGYTDSTGSKEANIAVSQKRADAVMAYLKNAGVPEGSFTGAKGYGPEWPIADNRTLEGRAQNRRVAVNVKTK